MMRPTSPFSPVLPFSARAGVNELAIVAPAASATPAWQRLLDAAPGLINAVGAIIRDAPPSPTVPPSAPPRNWPISPWNPDAPFGPLPDANQPAPAAPARAGVPAWVWVVGGLALVAVAMRARP